MLTYILFFIICLIIAYGADNICNKRNPLKPVLFIIVFLFMGLRYGVGQDYFFTYVPVFNSILHTGTANGVEPGYILYNKIILFFSKDYAFLFISIAFIFCLMIFLTIKEYKVSWLFVSVVFIAGGFYFYSFNVMRQCLTISMFYYSLKFVKRKKILLYMIINLLAFFIHKSAIIFIPLYFVLGRKFSIKTYTILLLLIIILRSSVLPILFKLLEGTKYINYLTGYYNDSSSSKITVSQYLNIFCFVIYAYLSLKRDVSKDKSFTIFMNVHFLGIISTVFVGIVPLIFRISTMFYLIQFVSVPYVIKYHISKNYRLLFYFIFTMAYLMIFANQLINNGNNIIPYQTIFQR